MKRIAVILLLVCALAGLMCAPAFGAVKPKLNFASANYFPTVMDKVVVEAFDRLGFSASIYYMNPAYGFDEANSGRFDGYIQWSPGLEKQYRNLVMVDEGLFQYNVLVCTLDENINIGKAEDLRRYKVGFESSQPFLESFIPTGARKVELFENANMWEMLAWGDIDVGLILMNPLDMPDLPPNINVAGVLNKQPLYSYTYLNKKHADLAPGLMRVLKEMKEDGSFERIINQKSPYDHKNPEAVLRVLHIHSGSPNAPLLRELIEGRDHGLTERFGKFEALDFYLDNTARTERIFWERFYNTLRTYVVKRHFDVVFVNDAEGLKFVETYYRNLFYNLPVVFSGINNYYIPDEQFVNFTGLTENYGTKETVVEMMKLFPYVSEIHVVTDESGNSQAWRDSMMDQLATLAPIANGRIKISFNKIDRPIVLADLMERIGELDSSTLVLLGPYAQKSDVKNICDAAKVPVFGVFEDNNGLGQIGGYMSDFKERGNNMTVVAEKIFIGNLAPRDIAVSSDDSNKWVFNWKAMERYGVDEKLLPQSAVILEKPTSFYTEYKTFIHLFMLVFLFMVLAIILLSTLYVRLININSKLHTTEELLAQEEKTKEEQRKMADYLAKSPVAYMELDLNYRVVRWNKAAEELFGYESYEMTGKNAMDYIIPDNAKDDVEEAYELILNGDKATHSMSTTNLNKNGETIFCEWYTTPVFDDNRRIVGLAAQAIDLTIRQNLENLLEHERTLLDRILVAIPDNIYYKDASGAYIMCNPSFESFVGKAKEEIVGKTDFDLFPKEVAENFRNHDYLAINSKGLYSNEEVIVSASKHKEIMHTSRIPLYDDTENSIGLIGISHNITNRVMIERKLKQVQKHLKKTLDTAPVAYVVSVDGIVVEANDYAKNNLHIEIGKPSLDYYSNVDDRRRYMAMLDEKGSFTGETFLVKISENNKRHFLANGSFTVHNGKIGVAWWGVDIEDKETTNKMLRDSQKDLEKVINSLPLPMLIVGVDMRTIVYGNMAFLNKFGIKNLKEAQRLTLYDLSEIPDNNYESFELYASEVFAVGQDHGFEWKYRLDDGSSFEALNIANLMMFKGHPVFSVVIRDITDEKTHLQLMQDAVDAANEANRIKSKFLANMSHEIRTPLNAIIGLSALELKKCHSEEINETYTKINMSAKILLHIIEDILDYSKLEVDKIEVVPNVFPLEDLVQNAILVTELRLENKPVEMLVDFDFNLPYFISADNLKLWQVLKNLLDNACKYTDEGYVMLRVVKDDRPVASGNVGRMINIRFEIVDSGVGLSQEQVDRIFVPFEQFHTQSHASQGGSGLGMAIVHRLVEVMGGEMVISSELGKGTTISFTLPFELTEDRDSIIAKIRQNDFFKNKNVLIVESNPVSAEIIDNLMRATNAQTVLTATSAEAVKAYQKANTSKKPFDIVLLDFNLTDRNGVETAKIMMNNNRNVAVKPHILLLFDSYSASANEQSYKEIGIKDVISKPVIPSVFINKIDKFDGNFNNYENSAADDAKYYEAKVLLVEDNEINREVGLGLLETFGIQADTAEDGVKAVHAATNKLYDLILMDIRMPNMDGYEATKAIRALDAEDHRNVTIIGLSAHTQSEDIKYGMDLGMNGYITKPVSLEDLHGVFKEFLKQYETADTTTHATDLEPEL